MIYFRPRRSSTELISTADRIGDGGGGGGVDIGSGLQVEQKNMGEAHFGHFLSNCWVLDVAIRSLGTPISATLNPILLPDDGAR